MPFFPIDDTSPRLLIWRPWVTWGMIGACIAVFWIQLALGPEEANRLIIGLGVIPVTLEGTHGLPLALELVDPWLTLLTYQFLHGGVLHLGGNMLYLWVFGDNVEDAMGHGRFLVFFLLCGALAGLTHAIAEPGSQVPVIGASGAVSGVLGAYLVLHPRAKVLVPVFYIPIYLPAWALLIFWFGYQVFALYGQGGTSGSAFWAHIGGFISGAVLIFPFRRRTIALFGGGDLPGGITLRDKARWEKARTRPWG